jgi:dienelactone hydrolase
VTYHKPSVQNPSMTRALDTVIWYPTTSTGPIDPQTQAVLNAPVDPTGGPFPVLVFSHGLCGVPTQSTFLTALLATRRYIVIAPSHPLSTFFDCANGTTNLVSAAVERPSDATFVLDQLLAAGTTPGSPFFGLVDATRLGMSGHSFGGQTTYRVASSDPRFRAAVLLALAVPLLPSVVTIPSLTMFGTDDTFVPLDAVRNQFALPSPPKFEVEIAHTGHFAFSNICIGTPPDCAVPAELTQDEAHAVVLRWVVPFLEIYLRGATGLDQLLSAPTPPGITLEAVR